MTDDTTPAPQAQTPDRIAKVIARAGVASRRDAERMILEGRVTVNGKKIDSPALDVLPSDRITVDGKKLDEPQETRLWLYYKPLGLVTTESDEKGRQTVFDALPRDLCLGQRLAVGDVLRAQLEDGQLGKSCIGFAIEHGILLDPSCRPCDGVPVPPELCAAAPGELSHPASGRARQDRLRPARLERPAPRRRPPGPRARCGAGDPHRRARR